MARTNPEHAQSNAIWTLNSPECSLTNLKLWWMLEVVNILPTYRGFEVARNKISWTSFSRCSELQFDAWFNQKHGEFVRFLPRFAPKVCLLMEKVKIWGILGLVRGKSGGISLFESRVWRRKRKKKNRRERESWMGGRGACIWEEEEKGAQAYFDENAPYASSSFFLVLFSSFFSFSLSKFFFFCSFFS